MTDPSTEWGEVPLVVLDGWPIEYYAAGETIPGLRLADLDRYDYGHDVAIARHPRLRRAVVRYPVGDNVHRTFGALHFVGDVDLSAIDRRVSDGKGLGDDERHALFTVVRELTCRVCHLSALLLVVEPSVPGTSNRRYAEHPKHVRCPHCDATGYMPHVEVLEV
jgi:hypothetical protein